jgi:two-component system, chemotaxis family, CheB/CheR fusion protein
MTTGALRPPDVLCIAASTGGPQAISELLDAFTGPPPCPVLVVQHLPGSFTGGFADRLDRRSNLDVHEAETGARLRAGEVLVAPGDAHLRIRHGRVRLTDDAPVGGLRPRADLTFADLADTFGAGTTAVVLSGMGSDGFDGAVAVADAGGQVLAQDAETCTVDGMPARIRAEGLADLVGPPGELGAAIDRAWRGAGDGETQPDATRSHPTTSSCAAEGATTEPVSAAASPPATGSDEDASVDRIYVLLRRLETIDLRSFKPGQIRRNIGAFADQHGYEVEDLAAGLVRDASLRRALVDKLTINVTSFFRDPERWAELATLVIPDLGPTPRVWNPGCADGSETVSVAMLLVESGRRPRIWATDANEARIEVARSGRYPERALADIPDEGSGGRRDRWFRDEGDTWVVRPELAGLITFDRHDAVAEPISGPVRAPFDLVVCRNLIIYLSAAGRDRLLERIVDVLADDGVVLLGNAERVLRPERFGLARIAPGLYRRAATVGAR